MNFELTNEQAVNMARSIYESKFKVYGVGNFDVTVEEFAAILKLSFNRNPNKNLTKFYEAISSKRGM